MTIHEIVDEKKIVVFQIREEEYGVDVHQVQSIEKIQPITRVPGTPLFVKGVINLRGNVIPIIDMRRRFGFVPLEHNEQTRIMIVGVGELEVGLIVDSCNDVIDIPIESIEPPPSVVGGIKADYLDGIVKVNDRIFILLNLDKVLDEEELGQLEQMEVQ